MGQGGLLAFRWSLGVLGTSRLDGKEQDIRLLLAKNVSKASIAKTLDVSRSALYHFIESRKGDITALALQPRKQGLTP